MFLPAFLFAWRVGNDALRFRLSDALAGIRFDSFHRGEPLLFGAFLRHFLGRLRLREKSRSAVSNYHQSAPAM